MKKLVLVLAMLLIMGTSVSAQIAKDPDGILAATWTLPPWGTPSHYVLSYTINGVDDSVVVETVNLYDSSVVLTTLGDSARVHIFPVSIISDTGDLRSSSIVYFDLGTGIGPVEGILWDVGN